MTATVYRIILRTQATLGPPGVPRPARRWSASWSAWPSASATCSTASTPAPTSSTPSACRSTRRSRRWCSLGAAWATRSRTARSSTCGCGRCPAGRSASARCLATLTVACPIVLGPAGARGRAHRAAAPASCGARSLSAGIAVIAYGALFVLLGLWVRRALVWGLAYILLWEGFVAIAGDNAAAPGHPLLHPVAAERRHGRRPLPGRHRGDRLGDRAPRRGRGGLRPHRLAPPERVA